MKLFLFFKTLSVISIIYLLLLLAPTFNEIKAASTCGTDIFSDTCDVVNDYKEALNTDNGWSWMSSALTVLFTYGNRSLEGSDYFASADPNYYAKNPYDPGLIGYAENGIAYVYQNRGNISGVEYLASLNPF